MTAAGPPNLDEQNNGSVLNPTSRNSRPQQPTSISPTHPQPSLDSCTLVRNLHYRRATANDQFTYLERRNFVPEPRQHGKNDLLPYMQRFRQPGRKTVAGRATRSFPLRDVSVASLQTRHSPRTATRALPRARRVSSHQRDADTPSPVDRVTQETTAGGARPDRGHACRDEAGELASRGWTPSGCRHCRKRMGRIHPTGRRRRFRQHSSPDRTSSLPRARAPIPSATLALLRTPGHRAAEDRRANER